MYLELDQLSKKKNQTTNERRHYLVIMLNSQLLSALTRDNSWVANELLDKIHCKANLYSHEYFGGIKNSNKVILGKMSSINISQFVEILIMLENCINYGNIKKFKFGLKYSYSTNVKINLNSKKIF